MSEATVPVDGEFEMARTFTVAPELERALEQPGLVRLTLDLSGTTFIDSTGLGVVMPAQCGDVVKASRPARAHR